MCINTYSENEAAGYSKQMLIYKYMQNTSMCAYKKERVVSIRQIVGIQNITRRTLKHIKNSPSILKTAKWNVLLFDLIDIETGHWLECSPMA